MEDYDRSLHHIVFCDIEARPHQGQSRNVRECEQREKREDRRRAGVCDKGGEGEDIRFACRTVKLLLVAQLVTPLFLGNFVSSFVFMILGLLSTEYSTLLVRFCHLRQSSVHILFSVGLLQDQIHQCPVSSQLAHVFLQDVDIIRPLQRFLAKPR